MLSTLKIKNPSEAGNFYTSVVGPLGILVALVRRKIRQGSSKSGIFSGRPYMRPFLVILFSLVIETWTKCWWIFWEIFFWKCTDSWDKNIPVSVRVDFEIFYFKIVKIFLILIGWSPITTSRVNKITMLKRFRHNILKPNIKFEGNWLDGVGRVTWTIIKWYRWIYNGKVKKVT